MKEDRRRKKEPKRHSYYLRITDRQNEMLQRYMEVKHFDTEVEAIRNMINGLSGFLMRKEAQLRAEVLGQTETRSPRSAYSGPGPGETLTDVSISDAQLESIDDSASVGDFAGRPSVGLPEPRFDED